VLRPSITKLQPSKQALRLTRCTMANWDQFAQMQLEKVANLKHLDNGALEGGIPGEGAVWAEHAALVRGTGIWVFFNRPAPEYGEQFPSHDTIGLQKEALRLIFEKRGMTELGQADGINGRFIIVVRAPTETGRAMMMSVSNLAQQIAYGLARDSIFGAIARGYAEDLGLSLDALLEHLGT
jgi:hypothetical protein